MQKSQDTFIGLCQSAGAPMQGTPTVTETLANSNVRKWSFYSPLLGFIIFIVGTFTLL